jgi:hypothetical protein
MKRVFNILWLFLLASSLLTQSVAADALNINSHTVEIQETPVPSRFHQRPVARAG